MKKTLFFAGALALVLAGCAASGPAISSNTAPGVKFKNFETYNFIQPLGTDRRDARTPMSSMLMNSMMREMSERGLRRSDESPDLLIDFIVTTEERLDVRQTPTTNTMHRSHWNRSFSTWPTYSTTVRQYTQGTLIVDLIDTANNMVVAEAAAEGRIRSNEFTQTQSDQIISSIIKDIW
jgi:PBP1b-binding outer membrane lipoprotein LpoB